MGKKKSNLTKRIFIGMAIGIALGVIVNRIHPGAETPLGNWLDVWLVEGLFHILGQAFVRAIKMLIVPLVFVTLVAGSCSLGDTRKLGRIAVKTIGFYLLTTCLAISMAITVASLIRPGVGLDLGAIETVEKTIGEKTSLADTLLNMIPTNPVGALASTSMLQVIIFALITGVCMSLVGEKARAAAELFESLNAVVLKMVEIVMLLAPFGVAGLVAKTFATTGFDAIVPLSLYFFSVLLALALHAGVAYMGLLKFVARLKPIQFFKNFSPPIGVAFSTSSSSATLPVTLETVEERMGVSKGVASFTLPLGATINMDGTAIMQGVAAVFIAQVYPDAAHLGLPQILTIILTATLASVGTAGVPGVGLITLAMVLNSVGLPIEGIGLIIGIDRLLDMSRTVINIIGDSVCTLIVAKGEGELDEAVFYGENELA